MMIVTSLKPPPPAVMCYVKIQFINAIPLEPPTILFYQIFPGNRTVYAFFARFLLGIYPACRKYAWELQMSGQAFGDIGWLRACWETRCVAQGDGVVFKSLYGV